MRYIFLIFLILFPANVFAACVETGITIVYINGIFTNKTKAESDLSRLQEEYTKRIGEYSPDFINGYNPSHLAGVGDLLQVVGQAYDTSVSDFDLKTILLQIHPQVQTRRLLLIGHSQGAFYTNAMYEYLLTHGEPKEAVGVYAVATPASFVAGNGKYLNNSNDKLLQLVAGFAAERGFSPPLPFNITLSLDPAQAALPNGGHSLSDVYLLRTPNRVVSDISEQISQLKPMFASAEGGCFTPPEENFGYVFEKSIFAIADPTAAGIKAGVLALGGLGNTTLAGVAGAFNTLASLQKAQVEVVSNTAATLTNQEHTKKSFDIIKTVYGSSVTKKDLDDLLGPGASQGGVVALALLPPAIPQEVPQTSSSALEPVISEQPSVWFPKSSGGGGVSAPEAIVATSYTEIEATTSTTTASAD